VAGADIVVRAKDDQEAGNEPSADIRVRSRRGTSLGGSERTR
jgi:hypothetical protein